jgi:hypothetical protein
MGVEFAAAITLRFPWSNLDGMVPADMAIWYSPDGASFSRLPDSEGNAGFDLGTTRELGYFLVGIPKSSLTASCP